jgi:hypothetical protein
MALDLGAPISYLVLEPGVLVYSSDGQELGTVRHVLAVEDDDIFDGLLVTTRDGRQVFVDAPQVDAIHERGVVLSLDAEAARRLPEPSANPAAVDAGPDDVVPDDLRDKLRRAWDYLSGNY